MPAVALYEPEIPGNAGNVARLCAATGSPLHLIGRLGFSFEHPRAKRAAMDYLADVDLRRHVSYDDFRQTSGASRIWMLSTRATRSIWEAEFRPDDILLFGPESRGLPAEILANDPPAALRVPMVEGARSLNLGSSVAIVLYEALRQTRGIADGLPGTAQKRLC